MSEASFPIPTEELMAHEGFLRSLAQGLLSDPSHVDDAVQQAWMAAIHAPPKEIGNLRGWLAVVTRNAALRIRRQEKASLQRERGYAKREATESISEFLEKEALRREVVDAVMALEEPYRETILLRHLENMPPRRIAKRRGVPVETVYEENRRALEMLRERLDAKHGGDRRAWAMGLIPLAAKGADVVAKFGLLVGAGVVALLVVPTVLFVTMSEKSSNSQGLASSSNAHEDTRVAIAEAPEDRSQSEMIRSGLPAERGTSPVKDPVPLASVLQTNRVLCGYLRDLQGKPLPARMLWPWVWAEGEGFQYFKLSASIQDVSSHATAYEGNGSIGFLGTPTKIASKPSSLTPDELRAVAQKRLQQLAAGGGYVRDLVYDEQDGSFSIDLESKFLGKAARLEFASGNEKRSENFVIGQEKKLEIVVDLDAVRASWKFIAFETIAQGSRAPVSVDDWRICNAKSVEPGPYSYPLNPSRAWVFRPGHFGIAMREKAGGRILLLASGFAAEPISSTALVEFPLSNLVTFEPEAKILAKVSMGTEPARCVGFRLADEKGRLIWSETANALDGIYSLRGIPKGKMRLTAELITIPEDLSDAMSATKAEGSVEVTCVPGEESTTEIVLTVEATNGVLISITADPGPTAAHSFEVIDGEVKVAMPSITIAGGNKGSVGLTGKVKPGLYRVIWYVNGEKRGEKAVDVSESTVSQISFP